MGNKMQKPEKKDTKIAPSQGPTVMPKEEKPYVPGEGIRSMQTSSIFRTLNFELYAKPNKTVMFIGALSFTVCVGYLTYMNYYHYDGEQFYEAMAEDGTKILRPKKSRWDS